LPGGGSLPEREWDHANRQQHKQVKGASKKMRFDVWFSLFFHFALFFSSYLPFTILLRKFPSEAPVNFFNRALIRDAIRERQRFGSIRSARGGE